MQMGKIDLFDVNNLNNVCLISPICGEHNTPDPVRVLRFSVESLLTSFPFFSHFWRLAVVMISQLERKWRENLGNITSLLELLWIEILGFFNSRSLCGGW
jgi:hypothetical protein